MLEERFLVAASRDDSVVVRETLAQGVNIESRDENGRTALLLATHHNAVNAARILIEAGADVNAMDNISDSPYLYAGAEGRLEILRMTLEQGADLASVNRYGGTALIPAAHHGHIQTVRELLKTKIDIDHVNYPGWTALLEAVILGDGGARYIEIVRVLIEAGADVNIPDGNGISPLAHAIEQGYSEIAKILRAAGRHVGKQRL
jgi:ankyrin repeat protein